MLTVDKELSSRKFKLNVFKSDYYTQFTVYLFRFWKCFIKYILFFHINHSGHQSFKVLFRPNSNSTWLSCFPPLILFIISTQKLDCEQSLIFLLSHSGPIAQSTREGRAAKRRRTSQGDLTFLLAVRGSEERRTTARGLQKSAFFKARPVELLFTFCPNLSNGQSECEVCCSDVNVFPNLSIVPKKLVMVTLKLT